MGTECSIHKDYEIDESPVHSPSKQWTLYSATSKHDNSKVTVFVQTKDKGRHDGQGTDRASKVCDWWHSSYRETLVYISYVLNVPTNPAYAIDEIVNQSKPMPININL